MEIQAIFYSEFDDKKGKIILYSYPKEYFHIFVTLITRYDLNNIFSLACDYIIPAQLLCGEIISVCVKNKNESQILGCPICISNGNYERNALIFNVCFIFDSNTDIKCYKPIIKKLNNIIKKMEMEYNFLSDNMQKV